MGASWSQSESDSSSSVCESTGQEISTHYVEDSDEEDNRDEEHLFFEALFLVLNRVWGYHGVLQRWRNDLQRAHQEGTHILDWPYIWRQDGIGYLRTLRLVQELVQGEPFTLPDLVNLEALARGVVEQREREYYRAQWQRKSNSSHQKILKTWTKLLKQLEYQTYWKNKNT
ncbi:hypothetical protein chiPu_0027324 [Chiloscyllium punctatum]|uniref:Uncharacterized protein n=1 Tax=Chiloscyllium punctatum TaxID=137246 RepID=A0A401TLP5_CHIPU|nr:hypothetical protein [Chiloscyllium punctatum]